MMSRTFIKNDTIPVERENGVFAGTALPVFALDCLVSRKDDICLFCGVEAALPMMLDPDDLVGKDVS